MDLKDVRLEARVVMNDLGIPQQRVTDDPLDAAIDRVVARYSEQLPLRQQTRLTIWVANNQAFVDVRAILADTSFVKFLALEYPIGERDPGYIMWDEHRSITNDLLGANAASGQTVARVVDGTLFAAGDAVKIADDSSSEYNTIASITGNDLTMDSTLSHTYTTGANGYVETTPKLRLDVLATAFDNDKYAMLYWGKKHTLTESTSTIDPRHLHILGKGAAAYALITIDEDVGYIKLDEFNNELEGLFDSGPKSPTMKFFSWE